MALTVCVFEGGWNLPLWAAEQQGFWAAQGLDVTVLPTPGSQAMVQGFVEGAFPLLLLSADNVVAYQQNLAEVPVPGVPDAVIFMGGDDGLLSLVAAPGVSEVAALRDQVVAVDAPETGFALVLYEMLAQAGLAREAVRIESQGSTEQRFQALLAGRCRATLLRTPYELMAEQHGCRVLQRGHGVLPHYQGTVGAVREGWRASHPRELAAFVQAYRQGLAWCLADTAAAAQLLSSHVPGLSPGLAQAACALLLDPDRGLRRDLSVDPEGLRTVQALRQRYLPAVQGRAAVMTCVDAAAAGGKGADALTPAVQPPVPMDVGFRPLAAAEAPARRDHPLE
ncbi:ABC transporter substrate-binding protein [Curvibacter sp. HBC61]|uniref:ABC transporter substrate-binding protein n=1 Tax=Curvibacter cyanobacteriorum TaxID=3026422 RepID=A0ABT5MYP4_9BURK|nr:ABC transporter substrate-binding protein [Curvibacter sp. HBC61]MDD0838952.1 ABC transporter substrate-binding protein [Curvibacter sp. HBC61]